MENFKRILKDKNLKVTKGRLEVMDILYHSPLPMNTEHIFDSLHGESSPSFTSLYRILNQLSNEGILHKNIYQDGIYYYEFASKKHRHYIVCSQCKRMEEVSHCPMKSFEEQISKETGFIVKDHTIELEGLCPTCQKSGY
ncbi:MAG: Fur family transcriptional regulator [Tissierellia bacterium]|nr:Fur family transcriptional regulator [Tissierellia bacterium]